MSKKESNPIVKQQFYSISPGYSCWYQKTVAGGKGGRFNIQSVSNKHHGLMSKPAAKKVKNIFHWLVESSHSKEVYSKATGTRIWFKINFITLTLAEDQKHPDGYIRSKMLAQFIQWMQRKHGVKSYMWKAEAQNNGRIHFHITTNVFIHWKAIRLKWNAIQYSHGYTRGMEQKQFCELTNGTDVKAVKRENELMQYMIKYFTKSEEGKRKIEGRLWAASNNLLNKPLTVSEGEEAFSQWNNALRYLQNGETIYKDFVTIIPVRKAGKKEYPEKIQLLFNRTIEEINKGSKQQRFYEVESF